MSESVGTVTYSVETTVNLGNFENVKPGISITAPTNGKDAREVLAKLQKFVDDEIVAAAHAIKGKLES